MGEEEGRKRTTKVISTTAGREEGGGRKLLEERIESETRTRNEKGQKDAVNRNAVRELAVPEIHKPQAPVLHTHFVYDGSE